MWPFNRGTSHVADSGGDSPIDTDHSSGTGTAKVSRRRYQIEQPIIAPVETSDSGDIPPTPIRTNIKRRRTPVSTEGTTGVDGAGERDAGGRVRIDPTTSLQESSGGTPVAPTVRIEGREALIVCTCGLYAGTTADWRLHSRFCEVRIRSAMKVYGGRY